MRLKTDWRRAGLVLALVAVAGLGGCDSRPKSTRGKGEGTGTGTGTGNATLAVSGPTPRQAADGFLKTLTDGKASIAQLTPAYRKVAGTTDDQVQAWLADFQGARFVVSEESRFGPAIVLRGRADAPTGKEAEAFALRMIREGDAYKVDWLHRTPRMGTGIQTPSDPDQAAAQDALRNYLDLLMGNQHTLAHSLMAVELKKSISPLPPGVQSKDGLDYDRGFLTQNTRVWIRDVVGYSVGKVALEPGRDRGTVPVELEVAGQKTPATIRLSKDKTSGWWLIDSFTK